jgi:predicted SAM-dependent methyltransferase
MRLLNLGCGSRYIADPTWVNIDFYSDSSDVLACDLLRGIPYANDHFDFVYQSHLLEHFAREDAAALMRECYRVLKPGSIIRIAVPNLEVICKEYLSALEDRRRGIELGVEKHKWMTLELMDQMVRYKPGGEMAEFLQHADIRFQPYLRSRLGIIASQYFKNSAVPEPSNAQPIKRAETKNADFLRSILGWIHNKALIFLKERDLHCLQLGQYRLSGEIHQWMYDEESLKDLLNCTGFKNATVATAAESGCPCWKKHNLDLDRNAEVLKPDSLFVEAEK